MSIVGVGDPLSPATLFSGEVTMVRGHLDTQRFTHDLYGRSTRAMEFRATTRNEAEHWQRRLRAKLTELLGGLPPDKCDLSPEVVDTVEFSAYRRDTVQFQSRPDMTVFGYFMAPEGLERPAPAILCLPGHGRGVDDIVGIEEDGAVRGEPGGYQRDFALQCVGRGYAVLAIEQFGFGRRRDGAARAEGPSASSCQPAAGAALLLGQTMIGWRVWDAVRALDYLSTRDEVDAGRLGVMGISGGGTTSLFSAALDLRIKAAVISGYFNTFRHSILDVSHCLDNYIPGVLAVAEMYDIAGLIAPRALFVESGNGDHIFPVDATRFAVGRAREVFRVLGDEGKLGCQIFEGGHEFHGEEAFRFLAGTM